MEGPVASCRCRDRPRATRREQKGLAPRRFARRTRRTRARSMAAATFSATLATAPRDVAVRASSARAVVLARASRRHHRASRGVVVVAPSSRSTASARPTAVAAAAPAGDALPPTAVFDVRLPSFVPSLVEPALADDWTRRVARSARRRRSEPISHPPSPSRLTEPTRPNSRSLRNAHNARHNNRPSSRPRRRRRRKIPRRRCSSASPRARSSAWARSSCRA